MYPCHTGHDCPYLNPQLWDVTVFIGIYMCQFIAIIVERMADTSACNGPILPTTVTTLLLGRKCIVFYELISENCPATNAEIKTEYNKMGG
jgi:hypothetical protein